MMALKQLINEWGALIKDKLFVERNQMMLLRPQVFITICCIFLAITICCCCGCATSSKRMKAPGRGGRVIMPRASFESNPRTYFRNLRAGKGAGNTKAESIGMAGAAVAGVAMLAWGVLKLFGA